MSIATQAQIASGEFESVCSMAYGYLNPDPHRPYDWKLWRDPDYYRWFIKSIFDPNGPIPPYSLPVLCGLICTAASIDPLTYADYEAATRAAMEILVAPFRGSE